MSEYAMAEELADLIKDNLHCKHLVLSMEEGFIDFLNNDTSANGVIELRPMNSYDRLLLHRLADIFGFAHESVGEGDDRHLILERCPETAIPSILVSDMLCRYYRRKRKDTPVEELALLVKDNLQCKHLILSMEEVFIDFLQDYNSSDGIMELQPMNPYNRHLLHRLADIYGFSHESVGEGDDRHLLLERCPESSITRPLGTWQPEQTWDVRPHPRDHTSGNSGKDTSEDSKTGCPGLRLILCTFLATRLHLCGPSILVSDILRQYDGYHYASTSHQLLRRTEDSSGSKTNTPAFQYSLEEREAAYLAARERIFSKDESVTKESVEQKPRNVPVVAQRMIAHALGQKIKPCNQEVSPRETRSNFQEEAEVSVEAYQETSCQSTKDVNLHGEPNNSNPNRSALQCETEVPQKPADTNGSMPPSGRDGSVVCKDDLKEQHRGAAKRMFAHALGLHSTKDSLVSKSSEGKGINRE